MPSQPSKARAAMHVSIVSNNPETLAGLERYLKSAGVDSHSACAVGDLAAAAPEFTTAVVIFPDDFEAAAMIAFIAGVRRSRPRLLSLIITRDPNPFRPALAPDGRSMPPIVLPRPSFGWDILDAIRAHANADAPT
jgi:hypothetical protein